MPRAKSAAPFSYQKNHLHQFLKFRPARNQLTDDFSLSTNTDTEQKLIFDSFSGHTIPGNYIFIVSDKLNHSPSKYYFVSDTV